MLPKKSLWVFFFLQALAVPCSIFTTFLFPVNHHGAFEYLPTSKLPCEFVLFYASYSVAPKLQHIPSTVHNSSSLLSSCFLIPFPFYFPTLRKARPPKEVNKSQHNRMKQDQAVPQAWVSKACHQKAKNQLMHLGQILVLLLEAPQADQATQLSLTCRRPRKVQYRHTSCWCSLGQQSLWVFPIMIFSCLWQAVFLLLTYVYIA